MRGLYRKQKNMLTVEYYRLATEEHIDYPTSDDIPAETWNKIFDVNPFETFESHVETFFSDLTFERYRNA
jgi:hypothetical protein